MLFIVLSIMIDKILKARPYIPRPIYSERIKPFIDKEIIKNYFRAAQS